MMATLIHRLVSVALAQALIMLATANGQTEVLDSAKSTDERISSLRGAAEVICGPASDRIDAEKLADFTHPRALKAAGGREHFTRVMKETLESSRTQFESLVCRLGESTLYSHRGVLTGVLAQTLTGRTVTKNSIVSSGTLVGISEDNGKAWTFINGKGFPKQFPEFADIVVIPKEKMFINEVEQ